MKNIINLGHPNNQELFGQSSDIVSGGNFPIVDDTIRQISSVLDADSLESFLNNQTKFSELISRLTVIKQVISNKNGFDYSYEDYSTRLSVSEEVLSEYFNKLCDKYSRLSGVCQELEELFLGNELGNIVLSGIIKNYLLDLIYEFIAINSSHRNPIYMNFKDYIDKYYLLSECVEAIKNDKVTYLSISDESIRRVFDYDGVGLINFLKDLKDSGIKAISFSSVDMGNIFGDDIPLFLEFVNTLGLTGIKFVDFTSGHLGEMFSQEPELFLDFIKIAGENGIVGINFYINSFELIFNNNPDLFIDFIKIAGESRIRHLNFEDSNFEIIFGDNVLKFIDFIKIAGESGMKYFGLNGVFLNDIFKNNAELFLYFIKTAGQSGIKSLDLQFNNVNDIIGANIDILEQILEESKNYGLRRLNLKNNQLENHKNDLFNINSMIISLAG